MIPDPKDMSLQSEIFVTTEDGCVGQLRQVCSLADGVLMTAQSFSLQKTFFFRF